MAVLLIAVGIFGGFFLAFTLGTRNSTQPEKLRRARIRYWERAERQRLGPVWRQLFRR